MHDIEVQQVFVNLVSNSADAIQLLNEKWIQIQAQIENEFVIIKFCDSGTGIDKQVGEKLFLPFFTTKEVGQGTGLGLSICKGIIEDHGGKIELLENTKNTTFQIQLPVAPPANS